MQKTNQQQVVANSNKTHQSNYFFLNYIFDVSNVVIN
jgi:hypothetical protein